MADLAAVQACQSKGNESDPERFVTLPIAKPDTDKGSSGLQPDLQPTYAKDHNHQLKTNENETANVFAAQLQEQGPILSSKDVHSGNQQDSFHSQNLTDDLENTEKFSCGNDNNTAHTPTAQPVENDVTDATLLHHNDENVNEETSPVAVSESDDGDSGPNQVPPTQYNDIYGNSVMHMATRFTTAAMEYRLFYNSQLATVIYSSLNCFSTNDKVPLSALMRLSKLKEGGNGVVYMCALMNYNKRLICKKEHKSLLCSKECFNELCHLKDDHFSLPILAYLIESCNCGNKNCSGFVGYLIMEYLPCGDMFKVTNDLKGQLAGVRKEFRHIENSMERADKFKWPKYQGSWQERKTLLIPKYQSAIVRLIVGAVQSTHHFHEQGFVHLDIKAGNFLVRKHCCDRDVFGHCDCSDVKFDVLLIDYDYVHKEGTEIQDAIHTGTYQYRALPLLFPCDSDMIVKAERLFDHYSLCIMIISIICGNKWCEIKLEQWKKRIIKTARTHNIETAEEISELVTSRLVDEVRRLADSMFGETIRDIINYVEKKLQESVKHYIHWTKK